MKGCRIFSLLTILLLILIGSSFAQAPEICIIRPIVVVFANGVDNKPREIIRSKQVLEKEVKSFFESQGVNLMLSGTGECRPLQFSIQINPTDGVTRDVLESLIQVFISDESRFWRMWSGVEELDDATREMFENLAVLTEKFALNDPVVLDYTNKYNTRLSDGETRIIVVSHSQGNFFSNLIHPNVNESFRNRLHIVSVANPDTFVADNGPHTTLEEDKVILAIRIAKRTNGLPEPLPANMTNMPPTADKSGHKFIQSYMAAGTKSKAKILDDISFFIPFSGECTLPPNPTNIDLFNECICLNPDDEACICWIDPNQNPGVCFD